MPHEREILPAQPHINHQQNATDAARARKEIGGPDGPVDVHQPVDAIEEAGGREREDDGVEEGEGSDCHFCACSGVVVGGEGCGQPGLRLRTGLVVTGGEG